MHITFFKNNEKRSNKQKNGENTQNGENIPVDWDYIYTFLTDYGGALTLRTQSTDRT